MLDDVEVLFPIALLIAAVLAWLWYQHAFIIRIKHGRPRLLKGKVTVTFLDEVATICREAGIRRGWLGGTWRGKRIVLVFSWHFPRPVRQRLRNLWMIHA